ncbi:MAG: DNA-3-methyladenine glycosylase [Phycisphaerales bacterium]|nr:DNA-3-methyladenine glycosylase [Planctomycetota bacterium]
MRRNSGSSARLERSFFERDAAALAPDLIGARLVRRLDDGTLLSGVIVEVEAYVGAIDRASHAFGGRRTPRNESMYAGPGVSYVYFTYGMHHCMNVVCAQAGVPHAVLIRALEPDERGLDVMRELRGVDDPRLLCSGPGRLCRAMAIDRRQDGLDLTSSRVLWLESGKGRPSVRARRIGIDSAGAWARRLLRWLDPVSPHVSRPADGKRSVGKPAGTRKNRNGR